MNDKKAISMLSISPSPDGVGFTVEVPEEFETWFMKSRGLSEWSDAKFNTWFKGLVSEFLSDEDNLTNMMRSEQQAVDIWERGEENGEQ